MSLYSQLSLLVYTVHYLHYSPTVSYVLHCILHCILLCLSATLRYSIIQCRSHTATAVLCTLYTYVHTCVQCSLYPVRPYSIINWYIVCPLFQRICIIAHYIVPYNFVCHVFHVIQFSMYEIKYEYVLL